MHQRLERLLSIALAWAALLACSRQTAPQIEVRSDDDLAGLTVAVAAGSAYDSAYSSREDITLIRYNTHTDVLQSVINGQAQVLIDDELSFPANVLRETGVKISGCGDKAFPTAFALSKAETALRDTYNDMQREMAADGRLDSLIHYWLRPEGFAEADLPPVPPQPEGKPIRVAMAGAANPICFIVDGEWYGLEIALLRLLGERTGRPLDIKLYDTSSALLSVNAGMADIMAGVLFITPERQEVYAFTDPYYSFHQAYFVKDSQHSQEHISLLSSLKKALHKNLVVERRWAMLARGVWETVKITLLSILLGALLGAGLCAMMRSRRRSLRTLASLYNLLIAGIPMLVLLLILFYVVFAGSGLSSTGVAVVAFALNFASGAAGIYDTSLNSVPYGQTEAGLSLGFTGLQTFRHIVLPQALATGLPLFKGQCAGLLKGTSIVGYIAIQDLTRAGDLIRSRTFEALVPLLLVTIIYFILIWALGWLIGLFAPKKHSA